jgi:hypothetical protein
MVAWIPETWIAYAYNSTIDLSRSFHCQYHLATLIGNMSDKAGENEQSEKKKEEDKEDNEDTQDEIKWDDRYDNPTSEIVLVSSDKVGFRIDAWIFKKQR